MIVWRPVVIFGQHVPVPHHSGHVDLCSGRSLTHGDSIVAGSSCKFHPSFSELCDTRLNFAALLLGFSNMFAPGDLTYRYVVQLIVAATCRVVLNAARAGLKHSLHHN